MSETGKIRELINKTESRITELERSIEKARDTFSSESRRVVEVAARVNAELDEWDKKMDAYDDDIKRLEQKRRDLKSEANQLEEKTKEVEKKKSSLSSEMNSTQKEIAKAENTLEQYKTKIDTLKVELERLNKETTDLRGNTETMKQSNEREFDTLENARSGFQQKSKELAEKEPITEFLLTEAKSEPPEVTIVARLIQENGQITLEQLKKTSKTNWGILSRAIETLEAKGIVSKVEKDNLRLLKK